MAAVQTRCACCGEPFERRAVNVAYCAKARCRRARKAANERQRRRAATRTGFDALKNTVLGLIRSGEITPEDGLFLVLFPPADLEVAA